MLRRWFPLWLIVALVQPGPGQPIAPIAPIAVDSASLLAQGLSNRFAPALADEPAYRTWHFRGLPGARPAELTLDLTLALGGPEDRLDLAIAYDNTSWIPIANVRWRVGPQTLDLSPWVRPGPFRVRLGLRAGRPERCWFSDPSWRGQGVVSDSPSEAWLPGACWRQPEVAARRDQRQPMGLPPSAVEPAAGGRLVTSPVAEWEPCADGWRAVGLSLPRGEQVALVLEGQADGAGLRLGRDTELRHQMPGEPVGLVLSADMLAHPPALVALTRDRPVLRAIATGPLALRAAVCQPVTGGDVTVEAVVYNARSQPLEGHLRLTIGRAGRCIALGYRFPPGPSIATMPVSAASGERVVVEVDDGQRISDSLVASWRDPR